MNWKAREVDNLYVADASVFPSLGAVNRALTAMANAIRVGEHIAGRLRIARGDIRAPAPRAAPVGAASVITRHG